MRNQKEALFLLLTMLLGCESPGDRASRERREAVLTSLETVDPQDGISQAEATLIAEAYFGTFVAGCGFADEPRLRSGAWVSVPRVGYGGEPLPAPITIDARNGAASLPGCPAVGSVQQLRAVVRLGGPRPDTREWPPCWHGLWSGRKRVVQPGIAADRAAAPTAESLNVGRTSRF